MFFVGSREGGYTPAWAAASKTIHEERGMWKGAYVVPYGVREEPSEDARRDDLARELWETTEMVLEKFGWA